jgi:hypothetical protein
MTAALDAALDACEAIVRAYEPAAGSEDEAREPWYALDAAYARARLALQVYDDEHATPEPTQAQTAAPFVVKVCIATVLFLVTVVLFEVFA